MRVLKYVFLFLPFLFYYSCNTETYSSQNQRENIYKYTSIAPSRIIQNPAQSIKPQNLPEDIDVIGKSVSTDISLRDFNCIEEKEKTVCMYKLVFGSKGGRVHFKDIYIPEGSRLVVFDKYFKQEVDNQKKEMWSINFPDQEVYIYFSFPKEKVFESSPFKIDRVMYIFDKPLYISGIKPSFAQPTECETYDIKCFTDSLDNDVWRYSKSTAMIIVSDNNFTYQCSGNLIRSKKHPDDPILITSGHCFKKDDMINNAVFWFDYINSECESFDGIRKRHYVLGGKILKLSKNDIAIIEIKGALKPDKYTYQWINWSNDFKSCQTDNLVGFSYPQENPLKFHEGYVSDDRCRIDFNVKTKKIYISCLDNKKDNGFKVSWQTGSVDLGSSGSALLSRCVLDNDDERWLITGVLTGKDPGCNPPTGIYTDFVQFIRTDNDAFNILENGLPEDKYEENDSMEEAYYSSYFSGNRCDVSLYLTKMTIRDNDEDWFTFKVPKGCEISVEADFNKSYGDLGFYLYDKDKNLIASKEDIKEDKRKKEIFSIKSYKDNTFYLEIKLKDDFYQTYSLSLRKKSFVKPPKLLLKTDIDENFDSGKSFFKIKRYYTNKNNLKLFLKVEDKIFSPDEIGLCISSNGIFGCKKYSPLKEIYTLYFNKEGKYHYYIHVKNRVKISNIYKIYIYYDRTPPEDGYITYKKNDNNITLIWKNFKDNLSGIDIYRLVYSKRSNISCRKGKILYEGKDTSTDIEKRTGYYLVCAKDKSGNWSKGTVRYIK